MGSRRSYNNNNRISSATSNMVNRFLSKLFRRYPWIAVVLVAILFLSQKLGYSGIFVQNAPHSVVKLEDVPDYSGSPWIEINGNVPFFKEEEITDKSFEKYYDLDNLGRVTVAVASIGKDLFPTEERGDIHQVKPTGWQYIEGVTNYNRCHMIAFMLTGENANPRNLFTGTRYLNIEGMLPFENETKQYISSTGNHVMYRVTPIFKGNNLLANGVLMEGYSVEDKGKGLKFCVYCYNVQPGTVLDYATGYAKLS